jgi:hypothetical protein
MAKPIKETPVLQGKDAVKFNQQKKTVQKAIVNNQEREKILQNFKKLQAIAKF